MTEPTTDLDQSARRRRPSGRAIAACVASAALVVAGTDLVTYAATGDSLLLGKANSAGKKTTVTNTGAGPALSLVSRGKYAPLAVSNSRKVVNLNADTIDGKDASQLGSRASTFTIGAAGSPVEQLAYYRFKLDPGVYQVTISGIFQSVPDPETGSPEGTLQCLVLDKSIFSDPMNPDYRKVYAEGQAEYSDGSFPLIGAAGVARVAKGTVVIGACGAPQGDLEQAAPFKVTFTSVGSQTVAKAPPADVPLPARGAASVLGAAG